MSARRRGSAEALCEKLGETAALALLGAHVNLLALIHVQEEDRRRRLIQFLVTAPGLVEQICKLGLLVVIEQQLDPFVSSPDAGWIAASNCQLSRNASTRALIGSTPGSQRKKAPAAAVLKACGP